MIKLYEAFRPVSKVDLGIGVERDGVSVPAQLMPELRRLNVRSGEDLFSLLAEYPQAVAAASALSATEVSEAAATAVGLMKPLMPPALYETRDNEEIFRFGAAIPGK